MSYTDQLKDPRWQRKRLEVLQRADFSCEQCSDGKSTLHVHHRLYRKGAKPWEYDSAELSSLCEKCHEIETNLRNRLNEAIGKLPVGSLEQIIGFVEGIWCIDMLFKMVPLASVAVTSIDYASGLDASMEMTHTGAEQILKLAEESATGGARVTSEQLFLLWRERHPRGNKPRRLEEGISSKASD